MTIPLIANRETWREGKVRPIPGNSPHDRRVGRVISSSLKESLRRSLLRHSIPLFRIRRRPVCVFQGMAESIWSDGVGKAKPNPGAEPTASRWSAPRPGQRTRREEHAPSHRPQMSSDRLFLDRVGRHQSPSPLHRHEQNNMHSASGLAKGDISTLLARGHFYFALTADMARWTPTQVAE